LIGLTQNTIELVNELSNAAGTRGLRVFRHRSRDELVLSGALVDGPTAGDEVVEAGGAVVFVDAATASLLADRQLDVRVSDGRVHLSLLDAS
jgi:iron-sulfur cluster assembly protein